jgi:membrane fusion protein (multidrug efflux system)
VDRFLLLGSKVQSENKSLGPFPHTLRLLGGRGFRGLHLALVVAVTLIGAWLAWFLRARVTIYETSSDARLEAASAINPIDAPLAGRVVALHLELNGSVRAGDVLVELDATPERLQLTEARAKRAGVEDEIAATGRQIAAEELARVAFERQLGAQLPEAESRLRAEEVTTQAARVEAERKTAMFAEHLVSESELERARADADRQVQAEAASRATLERVRRESGTGGADRQSRIAGLRRDAARLDGELLAIDASIQRLEHEIEMRMIRAPSAGRVGEVSTVRVGSVLAPGNRIATVVAEGSLRVVAFFTPESALGRIRPGQAARVRLDGFPWGQFGSLSATVGEVATELRDGRVRIELGVRPDPALRIPLQHGLPGSVEVTIGELTPAMLVLHAIGRYARDERGAPPASSARPRGLE